MASSSTAALDTGSHANSATDGGSESRPDKKNPRSWAGFWNKELKASQKTLRRWRRDAQKVVKHYIDDRAEGEDTWFKLNLFHANITTLKAMMYGRLPEVKVQRRFNDQDDDDARVAAIILERLLNYDIQENGEEYNTVLRSVLEDRLVPGMGCSVVRYDMETETIDSTVWDEEKQEEVKTGETEERLDWEDASVEYMFWGDVLWSWSRNWSQMRWIAFRHHMTKEKVAARFGKPWDLRLDYKRTSPANQREDSYDRDSADSVDRAEIWEIWDKETGEVFWHQENQTEIMDQAEDPLGLEGFFPCPPFFIANTTTTLYRPVSDYWMAKDLYQEINRLATRCAMISEAVKVVGVYDKQQEGVQRMLKEGIENDLIPVDNWAMMAEKGGLKGVIDWFPVKDVAETLAQLNAQLSLKQDQLYQITGMSDILRGAASESGITATEQELKAKFASVRVQALQDEFARFCSDLLQIKAEIISKLFDAQTIIQRANVSGLTPEDQERVPAAVALIKRTDQMLFRIEIKPESVAMVDFAKKQQERTAFIEALGFALQSMLPIGEAMPQAIAPMLKMLQWALAGFKGSEEIEGVLDGAIEALQQNPPQQQQDDNGAEVEMIKAKAEMEKAQAALEKIRAESERDQMQHGMKMREMETEHAQNIAELTAQFQADMQRIIAQAEGKITEQAAQTEGKIVENAVTADISVDQKRREAQIQTDSGSDDG